MPISDYQDYSNLIESIYFQAESNVLLPGLPKCFVLSSGTSSGKAKLFPLYSSEILRDTAKSFPPDHIVNIVQTASFNKFNKHSKGINIITRYIKNFSPKIHLPVTYISNVLPPNRNDIEPEFANTKQITRQDC